MLKSQEPSITNSAHRQRKRPSVARSIRHKAAATIMKRPAARNKSPAASAYRSGRIANRITAPSIPKARPRRCRNQRLTTVDPITIEVPPEPAPMITPQNKYSCQGSCMKMLPPAPKVTRVSIIKVMALVPYKSINRPKKGPASPNKSRLTETAPLIVSRLQLNSCSSDSIMMPGTDRSVDATNKQVKVTASTTQA